jgi:AraC family transcriptional regulator of adaptative response/methylated-DNA-[protein]-cysteine methyltransferase
MHAILEFAALDQAPFEGLTMGVAKTPFGSAVMAWDRVGLREVSLHHHASDALRDWVAGDHPFKRDDRQARDLWSQAVQGLPLGLPLVLCGTAFQRKVWVELMKVESGQTVSYGQLASRLGKPLASRAVGSAVGANRLGFVVPCHRVVRQDGVMGQFRWGPELKAKLLVWESPLSHE